MHMPLCEGVLYAQSKSKEFTMHGQTVKSPNMPAEPGLPAKNAGHASAAPADDPYAQGSFTMRKMLPWQIWAVAIVAVAVAVLGWLYI